MQDHTTNNLQSYRKEPPDRAAFPDQGANIAKVQKWLGHANVSTTRMYDHRKTRPEDSPVFKVSY